MGVFGLHKSSVALFASEAAWLFCFRGFSLNENKTGNVRLT